MQVSSESTSVLTLPRDVWTVIVKFIHLYDTIFLRASSKWLNKLCKEIQPFPRFHVLDQDSCMDYLVENGFTSLLDYVKDVLHFEWTSRQCSTAIKSGQLDVLKHLQANGCLYDEEYKAIEDCTQGTCSLDMLKYLHEGGITWELASENSPNYVADMARHGHIECIKYAIQTGCKEKTTYYTPSVECLDFLIENKFDWDSNVKDSICEEAAIRGDVTMLKYAHQKGAKLNDSARKAMGSGHLDCLKYAVEHAEKEKECNIGNIKTIECFKFLLEKYGLEKMKKDFKWVFALEQDVEYLQFVFNSRIPVSLDRRQCRWMVMQAADSVEKIKFLKDSMVPLTSTDLYTMLAFKGNLEGLKFAVEQNIPCESDLPSMLRGAFQSQNIAVIKFVLEKFSDATTDFNQLIDNNIKSILQQPTPTVILEFLTEKGYQWTPKHLEEVTMAGNLSNMAFLLRQGCQWEKRLTSRPSNLVAVKFAKHHGCQFVELFRRPY